MCLSSWRVNSQNRYARMASVIARRARRYRQRMMRMRSMREAVRGGWAVRGDECTYMLSAFPAHYSGVILALKSSMISGILST